jgi:putative N6-adenine-specific DNA methylase
MHLNTFEQQKWDTMVAVARKNVKPITAKIYASDWSQEAITNAEMNAKAAGMDGFIQFEKSDFRNINIPEEPGVIILNPEYGDRLGEEEKLMETYREIGDLFKKKCQGYTGYIFTGNKELSKNIGLRTKRRIPFYNGNIECRLLEYELYAGSKKKV